MGKVKPPIGPASEPQREVFRIIIELGVEDGLLHVKPTQNAIQTLGMLKLAEADIIARLQHQPEENRGGKIIIPSMKLPNKVN